MAASTTGLETIDVWGEGGVTGVENRRPHSMEIKRSLNWGLSPENLFASESRNEAEYGDEEALKWAALEKLPTYDRMRTAIIEKMLGSRIQREPVDLSKLRPQQQQQLVEKLFGISSPEEDNERILYKLRDRIDKVGIAMPTVEVRFEHLNIEAKCYVGGRALPTLYNAAINTVEGWLTSCGLPLTKKAEITIIHDVSGIIKPGRMTLLLGPPSSGKTTLLLALAGKLSKELKVGGKVTYNGHGLHEFVPQKTSAYISQNDLHIGEMTVRETLDFSARCQGVGTRYELLAELSKREKERCIKPDSSIDSFMKATAMKDISSTVITDYTLKILGLDMCAEILVGDDMHRGISGGQRKRVTTGEMIVGPTKTLFMDEISTGLDSSTTFQIIKVLRDITHVLEATIVISLLQPAPETYALFDDIILLSEGQIVYHGPREYVLEFFERCGFRCPERKGVADFLQEVTSLKDQEQYWHDKSKPYHMTSVKDFVEAFQDFHVAASVNKELAVPFDKSKSHKAALTFEKYSVTKWEIFWIAFQREWLLMKRNSFVYIFKTVQLGIMALIAMTLYFRTEMHRNNLGDAQVYGGALFFGIVSVMFNGFADISMTIVRLPVFFKQRDLLFFPSWAFSISTLILRIPSSIVESVMWIIITYYTIGFAPAIGRFFRQLFLLIWIHQMSSGLFRLIAGVCRSQIVANTGGSFALLVIFVLGGFLIPRTSIKPWWIWGYWISPLSYAQQAVNLNEYLSPQWDKVVEGSPEPLGIRYLKSIGGFTRGYWYWLGVGALIGYTILFNILFTISLSYFDAIGKPQAVISEEQLAKRQASLRGGVRKSKRSIPRSLSSGSRNQGNSSSVRSAVGEVAMARISGAEVRDSTGIEAAAGVAPKRGMILPFRPLAISFRDVQYYVDMPAEMKAQGATDDKLQLLQKITGAFRPGVLTALVGVSGAGKTTLMDVLAGRKTGGYIEGDIRISGFPKKQETFARISGYCEQNDIHSPQVTIHESLIYSAWLRLAEDIGKDTKSRFVREVMDLVELTSLKDALVGLPGVTGLSTEQRKRLTIAVELVANPSIIFMDEPTSGLDARAAAIVMRTVRNTVDTGRTVVCTIHQPSIDIFEAFDELLLLKRGGQIIYAGPLGRHSHKLVEFFEAIPGVPKIADGYNPATWMLDVTSMAVEQRLGIDFAEYYSKSSLYERNKTLVEQLSVPASNTKDLKFRTQYSQPFFSQISSCLWKQYLTYWRSPDYNNVRFFFTVGAALLFGSIFWNLGANRDEQTSLYSIMGAMYGAVLFIGVNNASTVQPIVATERTVFYRERAAGMYSTIPYAVAQVLIEIPYILLQTILYSAITYAMIGLEWTAVKFSWYMFFMFFTFMYFTYYGMMAVALTPNHQIAAVVAAFFYSIFNLFSGFLVSRKRIPVWWIWYYWACPVAWTLYGLIVSQFGDVNEVVVLNDGSTTTVKAFVEDSFGFNYDFLPYTAMMIVIFPVVFAFIFMFCIKFLNFQTR
ncbi:hypothetical protein R1sor_014514 [Riccia sorocarpa]|uniref:ABC transporter domain-containing protein n=1 Tax=Riccia sorocarpa TaxID=122646 RepID=A0ABD3HDF8_9MARC